IIYILLIGILLQSCSSQEKDLAKITFTEKYEIFFGDIPNKVDKDYSMIDPRSFNSYKSESDKILNFDGIDLSGYRDKKGEFGTNNIRFEFSKEDNTLNYYYVTLFTTDKVSKLIETLNKTLGKPVYIDYFEDTDRLPDALLWEDKTSFYSITGATQNQVDFEVFNKKNNMIRNKMISGSFQYYGDYLDYLDEENLIKNDFSYKNYVDEMTKEGSDYYIDNYRKP
ncbi:hypothetical protein, partial [Flavobacterium sp. PL002]|uniref:hypothetical protein n=1 Tax=Flavobacterium sp. PL002 TaxID=1897058 RepID=UPI001787827D